jgi:hypothetical protein
MPGITIREFGNVTEVPTQREGFVVLRADYGSGHITCQGWYATPEEAKEAAETVVKESRGQKTFVVPTIFFAGEPSI